MLKKIDHFVITTADVSRCLAFYQALGFETRKDGTRYALFAGDFKLNVHILDSELDPHAATVCPGSADFCIEVSEQLDTLRRTLAHKGIRVSETLRRHGVRGEMQSIYMRDPDGNLIELCNYAALS